MRLPLGKLRSPLGKLQLPLGKLRLGKLRLPLGKLIGVVATSGDLSARPWGGALGLRLLGGKALCAH